MKCSTIQRLKEENQMSKRAVFSLLLILTLLASMLATQHNLWFYQELMRGIRTAIAAWEWGRVRSIRSPTRAILAPMRASSS